MYDDYDNYYLQETRLLAGARNDFRYETKAKKVMVDFKFDALYREVFIENFQKSC